MPTLTAVEVVRIAENWQDQLRVEHGEHGGEWSSGVGGALKDALKLADRIDLEPGETFAGSAAVKNDYGAVRLAVTRRGHLPSVRLGIGTSQFGGRKDGAGPWRGRPPATAAENERRAKLLAERQALETGEGDFTPEQQARYDALDEMDLNGVYPSGYTARLDAGGTARLRDELQTATQKAAVVAAADDARWAEVGRLEAAADNPDLHAVRSALVDKYIAHLGQKAPDGSYVSGHEPIPGASPLTAAEEAELDRLTELWLGLIEAHRKALADYEANNDHYDVSLTKGTVPGEWADVHYEVYVDDPSMGVRVRLAAVPHGADGVQTDENGEDVEASLDLAETTKLLDLLGRATAPSPTVEALRTALDVLRIAEGHPHPGQNYRHGWIPVTHERAGLTYEARRPLTAVDVVRLAEAFDPSAHPRAKDLGGTGGRFASLASRLAHAILHDGDQDAVKTLNRRQLTAVAKTHGIQTRGKSDHALASEIHAAIVGSGEHSGARPAAPASDDPARVGRDALQSVPVHVSSQGIGGRATDIRGLDGLTERQRQQVLDSVDAYRGLGYKGINQHLRTGEPVRGAATVVAGIDRGMRESALPEPIVVFRSNDSGEAIFGSPSDWPDDLTGREWTDAAYTSTTAVRGILAKQDKGTVAMRVSVPAGTPAMKLSDFESEVLLDRGLTFRVVADHGPTEITDGLGHSSTFDRYLDVEVVPAREATPDAAAGVSAKKAAPKTPAEPADLDALRKLGDKEAVRDALDLRKVDELKAMLGAEGLPKTGRKRDLVDRLTEHVSGPKHPRADDDLAKLAKLTSGADSTTRPTTTRPPAKPVPIRDLFEADDSTIETALRDVYEGQFGPYATRVSVHVTRAGTRTDSKGRVHEVEAQIGVSGVILDSSGQEIGSFGRSISPQVLHYTDGTVRREIWAYHPIVQLEDKYQGGGFGGEFSQRVIDWYRASGVHGISLHDHNGYVWASQGFNFGNDGSVPKYLADNIRGLIADLRAGKTTSTHTKGEYRTIPKRVSDAPDLSDQIESAEEILRRIESTKPGDPSYPTAYEISQLGRRRGQHGKAALWLGKLLFVSADQMILNPDEGEVLSQ